MGEIVIRKMNHSDTEELAELEQLCFSSPWSYKLIEEIPDSPFDTGFVLEEDGKVKAYAILRILAGEGEIQRIGVLPSERRRGIGGKVMEAMTGYARENGAEAIFLEVREGNTAARSLYKSWGFEDEGRRKDYYTDPKEDAILMVLHDI